MSTSQGASPTEKPRPASETGTQAYDSARSGAATLEAERQRYSNLAARCSNLRLLSFLALGLGLLGGIESTLVPLLVSVPAFLLFLLAFLVHGRSLDRVRNLDEALTLRAEAAARRTNQKHGREAPDVPDEGTALEAGLRVYADEPETFELDMGLAEDLDVLRGPRSLFSLLDASSTAFGSRRLRHMLLHPLRRAEDLRHRQEAVSELAERDQVRSDFLARLISARRHSLDPLTRLLYERPAFANRGALALWARVAGTVTPLLLITMVLTGRLELAAPFALLLVLNLGTIGKHSAESNRARDHLLLFHPFLETSLRLRDGLAAADLKAPLWAEVASVFADIEDHARRLKRRMDLLSFHDYGVLFEIVNAVTLWELRLLPGAARLFLDAQDRLRGAAGALGEAEALLCLSLPLAEQGYIQPEIVDRERPVVAGVDVAHPLLPSESVVANPVDLGLPENIWIVTGSNMSGKSTYLKAIGTNVVLAGAGGPVRAREFRWTPVAIFSDMNVRDSLDDGKSYFRVEVERVLKMVRAAQEGPRVLAIFDELFRGTNSDERLAITRALLRYVRSSGALVVVATHDRKLADLVTVHQEEGMTNRHLRESVEDGVMRFDFRVREGPAATRNAIRVLEAQGYPKEITDAAWSEVPE